MRTVHLYAFGLGPGTEMYSYPASFRVAHLHGNPHASAPTFYRLALWMAGKSAWTRVDALTGKMVSAEAQAYPALQAKCVVQGLDATMAYAASIQLGNASRWGDWSMESKPFEISSFLPRRSAAPIIEPASPISTARYWISCTSGLHPA